MPKFYRQNRKRKDPRYFLNEGMVDIQGYKWHHDDNRDIDKLAVLVDGSPMSVREIFKDLHEKHEEWSGWMDNITDPEAQDDFMAEHVLEAVRDWATANGHEMAADEYSD